MRHWRKNWIVPDLHITLHCACNKIAETFPVYLTVKRSILMHKHSMHACVHVCVRAYIYICLFFYFDQYTTILNYSSVFSIPVWTISNIVKRQVSEVPLSRRAPCFCPAHFSYILIYPKCCINVSTHMHYPLHLLL